MRVPRTPKIGVEVLLGSRYQVAWTERDVVPDDWQARVSTVR